MKKLQQLADSVNARQKLSVDVITRALLGQNPTASDEAERERLDAEGKAAMRDVMKEMGFPLGDE